MAGASEQFSTRWAFMFAAMGSAVGLGNIWRFPFVTGENGGGAFVLLYLLFIVLLGAPALMALVLIGRRGRSNPIDAVHSLAVAEKRSPHWRLLGWLTVVATYILLTYFSVIASWSLEYMVKAVTGGFAGFDATMARNSFEELMASPVRLAVLHGIFMALTVFIVARGIKGGIEKATSFLMPMLFVLLVGLVLYAVIAGDGAAAFNFLFRPDFSRIDATVVLLAVGQALFTLSVGGSGMIVYGAYFSKKESIPRAVAVITVADTGAALLAGLMIFPIVFASGLAPSSGPGLIFMTLPIAFGEMPGGMFVGCLFFVLLLFAALTTSISMTESPVAWLNERFGVSRKIATMAVGAVAWFIGLAAVFSFNIWSDVRPLGFFETFRDKNIFDTLDYFIVNIALPVSALLLVVFVGWIMSREATEDELGMANKRHYAIWRVLARYAIPAGLLAVFVLNL